MVAASVPQAGPCHCSPCHIPVADMIRVDSRQALRAQLKLLPLHPGRSRQPAEGPGEPLMSARGARSGWEKARVLADWAGVWCRDCDIHHQGVHFEMLGPAVSSRLVGPARHWARHIVRRMPRLEEARIRTIRT